MGKKIYNKSEESPEILGVPEKEKDCRQSFALFTRNFQILTKLQQNGVGRFEPLDLQLIFFFNLQLSSNIVTVQGSKEEWMELVPNLSIILKHVHWPSTDQLITQWVTKGRIFLQIICFLLLFFVCLCFFFCKMSANELMIARNLLFQNPWICAWNMGIYKFTGYYIQIQTLILKDKRNFERSVSLTFLTWSECNILNHSTVFIKHNAPWDLIGDKVG